MDYFVFLEELKMKRKEITVLKVEPLKKPTVCTLTNELEELQKAVSIGADYTGLIEIIEIGDELGKKCWQICKCFRNNYKDSQTGRMIILR